MITIILRFPKKIKVVTSVLASATFLSLHPQKNMLSLYIKFLIRNLRKLLIFVAVSSVRWNRGNAILFGTVIVNVGIFLTSYRYQYFLLPLSIEWILNVVFKFLRIVSM